MVRDIADSGRSDDGGWGGNLSAGKRGGAEVRRSAEVDDERLELHGDEGPLPWPSLD